MKIAAQSRPKPGESECGDGHLILEFEAETLVAVADGLGHGSKAAEASGATCAFIKENAALKLTNLIERCSKAISHTRGVALTVLRINHDKREIEYAAVGNVEARAISKSPFHPVNAPGIVGSRVRTVQEMKFPVFTGDLIVVFTDGISSRFHIEDYRDKDEDYIARYLIQNYGKDHDDATCIVIKYA